MATSLARKHSNSTDEKKSGRGRLILVSNRGPVECYLDESGRIKQRDAGGGVAVALASVARTEPVTWIASASSDTDRRLAQIGICWPLGGGSHLKLIDLPDNVYEPFYNSFCNPLLWFVQHSLAPELRCDVEEEAKAAWQSGYVPANRVFAEAVIDEIDEVGESSRIMLHDYHLYLAPRLIRDAKPDVTLQQFIHIPWPAPHSWLALPGGLVRQICDGLLANDSIAFQTDQDAANFLATCRAFLSIHASICEQRGEVRYRGRATFVRANPISVDPEELRSVAAGPDVQQYERMLAEVSDESAVIRLDRHQPSNKSLRQKSHVKTIVRVDRLDPSKNILRGFQAYGHLLKNNPKRRGRVKFLAFLVPSRSGIREYDDYAREVFALVDDINSRYGTEGWTPISVFHEQNRPKAFAGLRLYDVLLVNSVADGMNLVSKEGPILNEKDGVLVLSVTAGSYLELQDGAIGIDPLDVQATASALELALELPSAKRAARAEILRTRIERNQLTDWLRLQLKDLEIIEYLRGVDDRDRRYPLRRTLSA